jgi:hypothetical protein
MAAPCAQLAAFQSVGSSPKSWEDCGATSAVMKEASRSAYESGQQSSLGNRFVGHENSKRLG